MESLFARLRNWWNNAEPFQRGAVMASVVGIVVTLVAVGFWASSPDWAILYSGLSAEDSGAIVDRLKTQKVPYKLSNDGSTIEVPSKSRDDMRITMAKDNLPSRGTLGYSRMDKTPFGQTNDMQKQQNRIMLEEELQKTIERLDPVQSARVIINPGSESVFVGEDDKKAGAMVVVHTKVGMSLDGKQVRGIVFIVTRSVPGLNESSIAIVDGDGQPLWDGSMAQEGGGVGLASAKQDAEIKYANALQKSIRDHLDTVLGAGKSTVWVRAELDYDKVVEKSEETTPGTKISVAKTQEEMSRGGAPGGAAGTASNTAPSYGTPTGGGDNNGVYKSEESVTNYEANKKSREVVQAPGKVQQLSVAVFLDEQITPQTANEVQKWLNTAIGADMPENANREVTINRVAFDKTRQTENEKASKEAAGIKQKEQMMQFVPLGALLIVGVLIVKALATSASKLAQPSLASMPMSSGTSLAVSSSGSSDGSSQTSSDGNQEPKSVIEEEEVAELQPIKVKNDPAQKQVVQFANEKPEQAALLIKGWINED